MERSPTEQAPITAVEIHERAVHLLTVQHCVSYPGIRGNAARMAALARVTHAEIGPWYARRAFAELLGERLPEVIPDEERLAALTARRDELVELQAAKGFRPSIVDDEMLIGEDTVLYALELMGNLQEATTEEVAVLRAQHSAEVMARYTVV
jgi:hypothetical protein